MITSFTGYYRFLSNFFPVRVVLDGELYPSVEHAYQAAKSTDAAFRSLVKLAKTPGAAKRLGLTTTLRDDWEIVKLKVMEDLLRQKFSGSELRRLLISTGNDTLVEGNTWGDTFWGMCEGVGENHLGNLLMKIRREISNV